jgi:hypothetical protein
MGTLNGRLPATILDSCMSLAFTLGGRGALGETRAGAPAPQDRAAHAAALAGAVTEVAPALKELSGRMTGTTISN